MKTFHYKEPLSDIEVEHMLKAFDELQSDWVDLDGHRVLHIRRFNEIKRFVEELEEGQTVKIYDIWIARMLLPRRTIDT